MNAKAPDGMLQNRREGSRRHRIDWFLVTFYGLVAVIVVGLFVAAALFGTAAVGLALNVGLWFAVPVGLFCAAVWIWGVVFCSRFAMSEKYRETIIGF